MSLFIWVCPLTYIVFARISGIDSVKRIKQIKQTVTYNEYKLNSYIPTVIFLYFYAVFKGGYQNGNI